MMLHSPFFGLFSQSRQSMELDASHVVSDIFVAEPSVVSSSDHASCELPLHDGPVRATDLAEFEPRGMEMAMTLNQADAVTGDELAPIKCHRWTFPCAEDFALRGTNYFSFVQCLLEMQRNVQVYEEGDVLAPNLVRACKLFVAGQCGEGYTGEMYHLFSHFLCNSRVFDEWEAFLRVAFEAPQASAETLLTMQVEQVWLRFRRLADTLEDIFGVLDRRCVSCIRESYQALSFQCHFLRCFWTCLVACRASCTPFITKVHLAPSSAQGG